LKIKIRKPIKTDGKEIYNLVKDTKVLDLNSEYLYLLQSTYFSDTSAVAIDDGKVIGFVSAFIEPKKQTDLFIWQVAVDEKYRGKGVAKDIIEYLLEQQNDIQYINATISPSNTSSEKLFLKVSKSLQTNIELEKIYDVNDFNHAHEDEILYKIGPLEKEKK